MSSMKLVAVCLSIIVLSLIQTSAFAGVPPMLSYQGKLMQPSGAPVPDGTYSIQFLIYDAPANGTPIWSQVISAVQTKGGLFSVLLGDVPTSTFDGADRFFAVKVGADPEMTPRQQIASVPFAQVAGNGVPVGGVIMWSGAVADIPQGWKLCDGQNGTPDLGSKFVVGVGGVDNYAVGATGGLKEVTLMIPQMPSHSHGIIDPGHAHADPTMSGLGGPYEVPNVPGQGYDYGGAAPTSTSTTGITIQNAGGNQPFENRPPYYALCFIMKTAY